MSAIIRIRIPKQQPPTEYDDDGNVKDVEYSEGELEEVVEPPSIAVPTHLENHKVWALNQYAQRSLREHLAENMAR